MKIPHLITKASSSSPLLPLPFVLLELFGENINSTEALLRKLYLSAEQDIPVDNKTLNKAANGGTKWSTKQKIATPLVMKGLKKVAEMEGTVGISLQEHVPSIAPFSSLAEELLNTSSQKEAEGLLTAFFDEQPDLTPYMLYQSIIELIEPIEPISSLSGIGQTTCLFLKKRLLAQAQLDEATDQETFRKVIKSNTLLCDQSITTLYESKKSNTPIEPVVAIELFMDFFYQLVACVEIDYSDFYLKQEGIDHDASAKKPRLFTGLISESTRYVSQEIPFKRILIYWGKVYGKAHDSEPMGIRKMIQRIMGRNEQAENAPKGLDEHAKQVLKDEDIEAAESQSRLISAWTTPNKTKRKRPKDETLKKLFDNLLRDSDLAFNYLCYSIAKMALSFGEMHDRLLEEKTLEEEQLNTIFSRYLEYYELTTISLEQQS